MGKALQNTSDDADFFFGEYTVPMWELNAKSRAPDGTYSMLFERGGVIFLHDNIKPELIFGSLYVSIKLSEETIVSKQRIR